MNKIFSAFCFFQLFFLTLSAEEAAPAPEQGLIQTLIMVGVAILFFYLILWRPEQKRRKALDEQRTQLKQGDRVIAMGIVGTVLRVEDKTVILKMYDGSKVEFLTGAVTEFLTPDEEAKADA